MPLWPGTGCENTAYNDVLYVEPLIGAESTTTLSDTALDVFVATVKSAVP